MRKRLSTNKVVENNGDFSIKAVIKGCMKGIIAMIILCIIASLIFIFFNLRKDLISSVSWWLSIIGIGLGGFFTSRIAGGKGWLHGGVTGVFLIIIFTIIGLLIIKTFCISTLLPKLVIAIIVGAVGGIIGVNI